MIKHKKHLFAEAVTQIRPEKKQKKNKKKQKPKQNKRKHALLCLRPSSSGTLMNEIMIK